MFWQYTRNALKAHVHPRCVARPILQLKTFLVVENRCLQCAESIFVNLPQFAKSGLKESLNKFFWYFPLHLFGYFGMVSSLFLSLSVCFTAALSMAAPSKRTVGSMVGRPRRRGSPKYIRLCESVFLIPGEMGKKLLAVNSTDSLFAEFRLHRMFNCKQRSRWNQLKAKQASQSNMNNALFNLTYEASDILNVNLSSGVSRLKLLLANRSLAKLKESVTLRLQNTYPSFLRINIKLEPLRGTYRGPVGHGIA